MIQMYGNIPNWLAFSYIWFKYVQILFRLNPDIQYPCSVRVHFNNFWSSQNLFFWRITRIWRRWNHFWIQSRLQNWASERKSIPFWYSSWMKRNERLQNVHTPVCTPLNAHVYRKLYILNDIYVVNLYVSVFTYDLNFRLNFVFYLHFHLWNIFYAFDRKRNRPR